jgi:hypothetical protein
MKKLYFTLLASILGLNFGLAQNWQTVGSGFLEANDIANNLQVLDYQDTVFVAYSDMNTVKLKRQNGSSWQTVVSQATENNYFKLIYGTNNRPFLITLSRAASVISAGSTGFFANIHEYNHGTLSLIESREMLYVPTGSPMNLNVSNFDFVMRPNGDMAGIIRYPSSARSLYNVKIGNNPWFSETVFYENIGGISGNAIEQSRLVFFDQGVMIFSRLFNQPLGTAHLFFHNTNSSTPTSSILNDGSFDLSSSTAGLMSVTSRADTVFLVHRDNLNNQQLRKFYHDPNAAEPLATDALQNFGNGITSPQINFSGPNNYMIYLDGSNLPMIGYVTDLPTDFTLSGGQVLGSGAFTLGEQVISPQSMSLNPTTGEVCVAYVHGPPMTQSRVRKFGCGDISIAYDNSNNELYMQGSVSPTATYAWTICGDANVISTSSVFFPTVSDDYQLTVTDLNCTLVSPCLTVSVPSSALNDASLPQTVKVYPNPANNEVFISTGSTSGSLRIFDIAGKQLYQNHSINDDVRVATQNWPNGMYFIELQRAGIKTMHKLVIVH